MRTIKVWNDDRHYFERCFKVCLLPKQLAMNTIVASEIREVMEAVHYQPAVSIITPFDPKMNLKNTLSQSLEMAADNVEEVISEHYPGEMGMLVIQKLREIIRNLNYATHKNSIAIYVSPVFQKVLYLGFAVEQKIIVDESFAIRDLVYSKKRLSRYLVLLLSDKESHMYFGNSNSLVRIMSNTHQSGYANRNEVPERVANFSDVTERKEIVSDKFLQQVDNSLSIILNAYPFPLFVMAPEKIADHFKKLTQHTYAIVNYVHGNFEEAAFEQVKSVIRPLINNWEKVRQQDILNQLNQAAGKKRLAIGMRNVWREAINGKGRLLLVEKNYPGIAQQGSSEEIINKAMNPYYTFSYIKDAIDDVIEKVLENGGDVEFVEEGQLRSYDQIALIQYY
jgi:hypothetical protein